MKITVQVQPNAKKNQVTRFEDEVWYLKIAAPPVRGKANEMLIEFLSNILGAGKGNLTIKKGTTARRKVISIKELSPNQIMERLNKAKQS